MGAKSERVFRRSKANNVKCLSPVYPGTVCSRILPTGVDCEALVLTLDKVFIERLWRSVGYENIYLCDDGNVPKLEQGFAEYFCLVKCSALKAGQRPPGSGESTRYKDYSHTQCRGQDDNEHVQKHRQGQRLALRNTIESEGSDHEELIRADKSRRRRQHHAHAQENHGDNRRNE